MTSLARLGGVLAVACLACGCSPTGVLDRDEDSQATGHAANLVTPPVHAAADASTPVRSHRAPPQPKKPRTCPKSLRAGLDRADALGDHGPRVRIADPTHNLSRFFRGWIDVALRHRGKRKLRVALYGDSNVARDWAAGFLRKLWGAQLGHGGHGYVAAGPPDLWYQHRGIRTKRGQGWRTYAVTVPRSPNGVYGHGTVFSQGKRKGAYAVWHSANGIESPVLENERFSRVVIHHLCEPEGGAFELLVDGVVRREVSTRCATSEFRRTVIRVPPGKHEVKLVTQRPDVSVFGAVFENDAPGIVVDCLGINSANLFHLLKIDETLFSAGMKARGYDLVILAGATSMTPSYAHRRWAKELIQRLRRALGDDISIVIFSQAPYGKKRDGKVIPRPEIARLRRDDQIIAKANHIAFWDYHVAMGGDEALPDLVSHKLLYEDMLHVTPYLHRIMMRRFARAMRDAFYGHLARTGWPCRRSPKR